MKKTLILMNAVIGNIEVDEDEIMTYDMRCACPISDKSPEYLEMMKLVNIMDTMGISIINQRDDNGNIIFSMIKEIEVKEEK